MATRDDLPNWVIEALRSLGGSGTIVQVAKYLWQNHDYELQASGDLFYTWQYDMRWACTELRINNTILPAKMSSKGVWQLNTTSAGTGKYTREKSK